jgi:beta-lactam-binding protein with PASTA domain
METLNNVASTTKTARTVSKAELTAMVDSGSKKEQIAEYYNLNIAQTTKLLKSAGLKIRKFHQPAFTLVD